MAKQNKIENMIIHRDELKVEKEMTNPETPPSG